MLKLFLLKFSCIFKKCALNEKTCEKLVHEKFTEPLPNFDKTCMGRESKKRSENQKKLLYLPTQNNLSEEN